MAPTLIDPLLDELLFLLPQAPMKIASETASAAMSSAIESLRVLPRISTTSVLFLCALRPAQARARLSGLSSTTGRAFPQGDHPIDVGDVDDPLWVVIGEETAHAVPSRFGGTTGDWTRPPEVPRIITHACAR